MEEEFQSPEDLLKAKQLERQARKCKKKQSFLKGLLRFLTGCAIIAGCGYFILMPGWYLPNDAFKKPDGITVQITNNKIVKTSKIMNVMKDIPVSRCPLFMKDYKQLKYKILSLAPVENVYIRRYVFPARLLIIIRESTPVVTVSPDANVQPVAAFTKDGRIITGADYLPLPTNYKTLLVLSYGNKGDDYHKWDVNKIRELEKIAKYVETFSREPVEYIDLRNPDDIFVKIKTVNIRLGKADEKIYQRIRRIPSIIPEAKKVGNSVKYIDISWEKVNYLKLK